MSAVKITGKNRLDGSVKIQGSKNAVLPVMAASVLCRGECIIHNCPDIADVSASIRILRELGASVVFEKNTLIIDSSDIKCTRVNRELMGALRSSVVFLGSMLSRCGCASVSMPGGCDIGKRPIDIHLASFEKMGVDVQCNVNEVFCAVNKLHSEKIILPFPSVGATENIILLAAAGKGVTTIYNAAKEPEIADLQNFLNAMGARIYGAGTSTITIYSVEKLRGCEYTVMPDRIEAATYLCAAAAAGGRVVLEGMVPENIKSISSVLAGCGAKIICFDNSVYMIADDRLNCPSRINTGPYPAFPTDAQSLMMSVMSLSDGRGEIIENIFENRFGHAEELIKMGAQICLDGNRAFVCGTQLTGADVSARDLRSGAALMVAGLGADGETVVNKIEYVFRGYDNIIKKLSLLGADIERVE